MVEAGVLRKSFYHEGRKVKYSTKCRCKAVTAEATAAGAGWPGVLDSMANTLRTYQTVFSGRTPPEPPTADGLALDLPPAPPCQRLTQ